MARRTPSDVALWLAASVVVGGCGTAGATPTVDLDPITVDRPSPTALAPVAFLTGCWRGWSASGTTEIEEHWGSPSENVMLGTTRYLRDGVTVGFEFGHLESTSDGIVFTPYPGGERSAHSFRLTSSGPGVVLFETPEHDYPKRIAYRLAGDGRLEARIDGGPEDPEPRGWSLTAVSCAGLPAM